MLNIVFTNNNSLNKEGIIILVNDQLKLSNSLLVIDQQCHGLISKTFNNKQTFRGKFGQTKILTTVNNKGEVKYLFIIGTGDDKELKEFKLEELGGKIFHTIKSVKVNSLNICIPEFLGDFNQDITASLIGNGVLLASYEFNKYLTQQKEESKFTINELEISCSSTQITEELFQAKRAVTSGVFLARDCISEPANVLYPESYAQIIVDELEPHNVVVEILGEREMKDLGMGAILGVGKGSQNESKLVVIKYNNNPKDTAPIALVGKGVTFDSGGISLKPSLGMADMKYDMAGSAAVVGTIKALAMRKSKVNVVGVIGLVENMPGGNAQRPSDIVKTMSGQTAEVLDTDAEGRLVLADVIWYAQDKFNPKCVVDLATLTGAIVVALGNTYAGLFANDDDLANKLIEAGEKVNEKVWRMPLHEDFDEMIKSDIADVANLGNVRGAAGSAIGAHFVGRFIKEDMKWAHLDIAGMAWEKKGNMICSKGAVGYGVRLLNQFIQNNYESN